ncbi:MAG: hypothetical protein COB29_12765 [Sulfitobacter sp.]|nr:MAG: hypothetical protein COB29_12765 [Sulfitobacter sp.]
MSELPQGWSQSTLAEVAKDISYGFTTSAADSEENPKLLRITDVQDYSVEWSDVPFCKDAPPDDKLLSSGDIVIARTGATTGKSYLLSDIPTETAFASYLIRVRSSDAVDPEYLWKFMWSPDYWRQITVVSKGTAQPGANASILGGLELPIPPLLEQRRIVAKLDRLSARSAAARDHLARTTKLATRAKQAILSAAFREEKAAEKNAKLGEIADVLSGFAFKSKDYVSEGVALVRIGDLSGTEVVIDESTKRLPHGHASEFSRFQLKKGDICVALSGATTGKVGVFNFHERALLNQRVASIRCEGEADQRYVAKFVGMISNEVLEAAYGGAQPNISPKWLTQRMIPWPSLQEREKTVRRIETAFARIDRMTEEANRAAHLLDRLDERLLAKAFRGELVPQDPEDEPAEALLTRIREARAAAPKAKRGRRKKAEA